tara:strand:+ start:1496 stop:2119 length:624 start_codon:yes stop_codon:yes gene_type:complete
MKNKNIVIGFDFDGVIVNSLSVMEKSWKRLNSNNNLNIPFIKYKENIGLKFNMILDKIGINENLHNTIYKEYFDGTKEFKNEITLYPYVIETLTRLKLKSIPIFIVTSKPRANTLDLLNKFNIEVDLLVCADDVVNGKPHKESGDLVLDKFGNSKIYYVGDMESDRQFAKNCKFNFIHANYGYGSLINPTKFSIKSLRQLFENVNEL